MAAVRGMIFSQTSDSTVRIPTPRPERSRKTAHADVPMAAAPQTMLGQPQFKRLRRLRSHPLMRRMLQEVSLHPADLTYPVFVRPGKKVRTAISSMPGIFQFSPDTAFAELQALEQTGVKSFILFGVTDPRKKTAKGDDAHDPDNAVCKTLELGRKNKLD